MTARTFDIEVHSTAEGSTVPVGYASAELIDEATIGRDRSVDFRLHDPTVSRQHVHIARQGRGFRIHNLTGRGTTCVNERRLGPDEYFDHDDDEMWLQVGRLLLRIAVTPTTIPVDEVLHVPSSTSSQPVVPHVVTLRAFMDRWEVLICGQPVRLFPSATRVLAKLAESPGDVVTHSALAEAADPEQFPRHGGASVPQLITFIRNMFDDALNTQVLDENTLRTKMLWDGEDPAPEMDRRTLLRSLIENVRGLGYRLRLSADDIALR